MSARWPDPEAEIGGSGGFGADKGLSCAAHQVCSQRAWIGANGVCVAAKGRAPTLVWSRNFALLKAGAARYAGGLCNTGLQIGSVRTRCSSGKVSLTAWLRACG
jgi:hypothetical protein